MRQSNLFLFSTALVLLIIVSAITVSILGSTPIGQTWLAQQTGIPLASGQPSGGSPATGGASTPALQTSGEKSSFDQFMTLFLAVAAGGIAYMASAMGMRRLEVYDNTISEVRRDLHERLTQRADKLDQDFKDEKSEFERRIYEATELQKRAVNEAVEAKTQEGNEKLEATSDDIRSSLTLLRSSLEERFGYLADAKIADRLLMDVPSIGEVHKKVQTLFSKGENERARELVRAVLLNRTPGGGLKASGDSNDWFNLGAELGSRDEFDLGLRVNLAGLEQQKAVFVVGGISLDNKIVIDVERFGQEFDKEESASPNVDLFAHALQYAQKIGLRDITRALIDIAPRIPEERRNWRYYQFVCDYHNENDNEGDFFNLVEEFRHRLPHEERAVGLEMEWYETRQDFKKYREVGEKWLEESRFSPGSAVPFRLARLAFDLGDYPSVLRYTLKGLEGSAKSQPNASIAALLFYRANAYDAMCVQSLQADEFDEEEVIRLYSSAVRIYRSQMVLGQSIFFGHAANDRCETLRLLLETNSITPPDSETVTDGLSGESDGGFGGNSSDDGPDANRVFRLCNELIGVFVGGDEDRKQEGLELFRSLDPTEQMLGRMAFSKAKHADDLPDEARYAASEILGYLEDA